jgi:hypothetical protein
VKRSLSRAAILLALSGCGRCVEPGSANPEAPEAGLPNLGAVPPIFAVPNQIPALKFRRGLDANAFALDASATPPAGE